MMIRRHLAATGFGFLGVLLALVLWHLWDDHRIVDEIRAARIAQTAAQAQQIQQFQQQQGRDSR